MKSNMKQVYRTGGFWALVLVALGFAFSCASTTEMYGSPPIDFELKVKVVDSLDAPIKNIQVRVKYYSVAQNTDSNGVALFEFFDPQVVYARFEDVDGLENGGQYRPLDTVFQFDGLPLETKSTNGDADDNLVEGRPRLEVKVVMKKQ